jgi:hypothetical protein
MRGLARALMWISAASGVFLAFGWPLLVSADPSSPAFHTIAVATVVAFLASLVMTLATRR